MDTRGPFKTTGQAATSVAPQMTTAPAASSTEAPPATSRLDLSTLREAIPSAASSVDTWSLPIRVKRPSKQKPPPPPKPGTPSAPTGKSKRNRARAEARRARKLAAKGEGQPKVQDQKVDLTAQDGGNPAGSSAAPVVPAAPSGAGKRGNKKMRGKRAGQSAKEKAANRHGQRSSPQPKLGKRSRPDDTMSPHDDRKRPKPERPRPHPTAGSVNYADACKSNDLCVAIMTEPFRNLTLDEANAIEIAIEEAIDAELCTPATSRTTPGRLPSFRGKAFHSEGVLKVWCEDDFTLEWLRKTAVNIRSPRPETRIVVRRQAEIPKKVKAGMFVPRYKGEDIRTLHERFRMQNPWYDVAAWSLYHVERQEDKEGVFLVLGIPLSDVEELKKRDRRVSYKVGSVYVRFGEAVSKPATSTVVAPTVAASTSKAPLAEASAPPAPPKSGVPIVVRMDDETAGGLNPIPDALLMTRGPTTSSAEADPVGVEPPITDWWGDPDADPTLSQTTEEMEKELLSSDGDTSTTTN